MCPVDDLDEEDMTAVYILSQPCPDYVSPTSQQAHGLRKMNKSKRCSGKRDCGRRYSSCIWQHCIRRTRRIQSVARIDQLISALVNSARKMRARSAQRLRASMGMARSVCK